MTNPNKQNETGPLEFQERLKKMQTEVGRIADPKDQQSRFQAISAVGHTAFVLGNGYFGTEFGETKEKALEIVTKVAPRFADHARNLLRYFDDVVVQTSYQTPDRTLIAPPPAGLLCLLSNRHVPLQCKIEALGLALNLHPAEMAVVIGVSERTIYNWLEGNVKSPDEIKNIMALALIALRSETIDTAPQGEEA